MLNISKVQHQPRAVSAEDAAIGTKLRNARLLRGLPQEALAKRVGVTFQQIQKYEHGRNRVPVSRLMRIAQILDVPLTHFLPVGDAIDIEPLPKLSRKSLDIALTAERLSPQQRTALAAIANSIAEASAPQQRCPHTLELPLTEPEYAS